MKKLAVIPIVGVLSVATALGQVNFNPPTYYFFDLGTAFFPNAISPTSDYVVGYTSTASGPRHVYLSFNNNGPSAASMVPLLTGSTLQNSNVPVLINDAGSIVGTTGPTPWAYEWNLNTPLTQPFKIAPSAADIPEWLNNDTTGAPGGQICGYSDTVQGMIWYAGGAGLVTTVADPYVNGGHGLEFFGMNNNQVLYGSVYNSMDTPFEMTYFNGTITQVSDCLSVNGISDVGPGLCGTFDLSGATYNPTACYWPTPTTTTPTALDNGLSGTSTASGINNNNWITGVYQDAIPPIPFYPSAYVWIPTYAGGGGGLTGGNMYLLSSCVSPLRPIPANVTLATSAAIDRQGDIVGTAEWLNTGKGPAYTAHGYLLVCVTQ